jgi:membrane protease subunit HflK
LGNVWKNNWKKAKKIVITLAVIVFLIIAAATSIYSVNDKQQGVVTRFGKVTQVNDAGLYFMLPFGIERAYIVDTNVYQRMELGYRTNPSAPSGYDVVEAESKMITGDYNIVNVDFFIEYKVSEPVKYLFSSYDREDILRNLIQSQIRNVVGSTNVDAVLTNGKELIQQRVKELVTEILDKYDIGLMLTDVKIQDSEPPTEEVTAAFKQVETAKQNAETVINEAKAYENAQIPDAQAQADKLLRDAEYLKQSRINDATERIALFEAMYSQYVNNPGITRSRMYYEMLTAILPGVKVYINTSEGSVDTLLPLESFSGNAQQGGGQ